MCLSQSLRSRLRFVSAAFLPQWCGCRCDCKGATGPGRLSTARWRPRLSGRYPSSALRQPQRCPLEASRASAHWKQNSVVRILNIKLPPSEMGLTLSFTATTQTRHGVLLTEFSVVWLGWWAKSSGSCSTCGYLKNNSCMSLRKVLKIMLEHRKSVLRGNHFQEIQTNDHCHGCINIKCDKTKLICVRGALVTTMALL